MFERMEISESIYEGVVEPLYKNPTRADANCADNSKKKNTLFQVLSLRRLSVLKRTENGT